MSLHSVQADDDESTSHLVLDTVELNISLPVGSFAAYDSCCTMIRVFTFAFRTH